MDLGTVLEATIAALLASSVFALLVYIGSRAQKRLHKGQLKSQVARRRRRRSLGVARSGHSAEFQIEDISATGAFVRTRGAYRYAAAPM